MGITIENTVTTDGDIEESHLELELDSEVYNFLFSDVRDDGYNDVEDWLREEYTGDLDEYGEITSDHIEQDDGSHVVTVTVTEVPSEEFEEIQITINEEDDSIVYEHPDPFDLEDEDGFEEDEFGAAVEMTYVVNMPGEITDTNAHELDEDSNTAQWEYLGDDDREDIYIESERGMGVIESMTGFTGTVAVLSFVLISGILFLRRR